MKSFSNPHTDIQRANEDLAQTFYANGRYNALFLTVTGIGFVVIYLLAKFNILGESAPQLLYISFAVLLMAALQIPALNYARRKKGIAANLLETLFIIIFATALTALWEGMASIAILVIFIVPLAAVSAGMPRKYYPHFIVLIVIGIAGIYYANSNPPVARLQTYTTAALASLAFLGTTGILLLTVLGIARSRSYRSLRSQLLISFVIIVTIPTLLATILSAVGAYVNNEAQVLNVLQTVSSLKENQINEVVNNLKVDTLRMSQDSDFSRNALIVLTPGNSEKTTLEFYRSFARNRLQDFQNAKKESYSEIMVLDIRGIVVISTDKAREGTSFQSEPFFRSGSIDTYVGFSKNPYFEDAGLVLSTPIHTADGKIVRGILVLRSSASLLKNIVESTPGFPEIETYLLDRDYHPLTSTRTPTAIVRTQATQSINSSIRDGKGTYENYAGQVVLGYYQHIESLGTIFIAEIPRAYVLRSSVNSLLASAILAIFAIAIAVAAIAISANSITEPISTLAQTASSFAAGQLSTRSNIDRQDEIGTLSRSYNQMAEQLQDIIGKLEQRVEDRTKELQDQTKRLRVSAEISRDAASSRDLGELLEQAGELIQSRFGFYHTGIFLLDNDREFAVLASSPTKAGKQMIANNHKLRIGEVGIVGRVAATQEPRITLDTGLDAIHFNNPLLPNTRSEMALPLKVENRMIGVLDVQSDQPQAFNEDDIAIMQILADQLATAIDRTRLYQQVEQNLRELEQAYGQFTREGWKTLGEGGLLTNTGYRFDNVRIQPISEAPEHGTEAIQKGSKIVYSNKNKPSEKNSVSIPIKLRGQIIGVVSANLKDGYSQKTISTIELAIERLASSLESARLYEEARLRADREQAIAQVATNITSAVDFDSILRTTVEEVGRSLSDTEVSIQIISDLEKTDK